MILFKSDWNRYGTAIADTRTTNESFLRLAAVYREMGVENHAFHLSLLNPALQGIDPHDPNLDFETKVAIATECQWNPWYVVREVIRLPPQGGPAPIPFKANRGNISMMWCFFNHIDYALIQPRQTGKSASTDVLMVIILTMMAWSTKVQLITKDHPLRRQNVARIKAIRDQLPNYLNPTTRNDADNTEIVTMVERSNEYLTAVGQKSREGADNLGRGLTAAILQADELPYIPNIHISLPVALAAATAARENAKMARGLYGNIFTTTAGRKDTKEGRFAYNLVHNGMYWNECLYDCVNIEDLVRVIKANSTSNSPMINGTFSHRQLGKTDDWLREAIDNARASEDLANRDFFNIWTSGTESSPLSIQLNQAIALSEMDPLYIERSTNNYILRWYHPHADITRVMESHWHILSLDSSNAVGRDSNGLAILDSRDLSITAASDISEANLYRYAEWLLQLMVRFPKTILMIENKSSAQGILDYLIAKLPTYGVDPFRRIYNRLIDNKAEYPEDYKELCRPLSQRKEEFYLRHKGKFGFMTTGNRRAFLYDTVLQQAAKTTAHKVRDRTLSSEIRGLVTRNGRVDHPEGGHDDLVMGWLLGHWFLSHGRHLDEYGLDTRDVMSLVSDDGATLSEEDAVKRGEQAKLRLEIEDLKEQLKEADSPAERIRIEANLKRLVARTEVDGGSAMSMDSILEQVKESKRKTNSLRGALLRNRGY
jgi:hypothetical protein